MATRSGLIYKPEEATMESEKSVQKMLQLLTEDHRKREDKIAAEHARREEIAAERRHQQEVLQEERAKREEERRAREREVQVQMDEMRLQMERLLKVVEDSKRQPQQLSR